MNPNEFLLASGIRSATFKEVGDTVTGFISQQPEMQQQTDFDTGDPKVWSDGRPRMQVKVILQTEERDPQDEEDSGERAVYIRGNMQKAVAGAIRQVKATGLEIGGKLQIRYIGNDPAKRAGLNGAKRYEARYRIPDRAVPVEEPPAETAHSNDAVPF